MPAYLMATGIAAAIILAITALVCWYKTRARRKNDLEQMNRLLRENALDRAISNQVQPSVRNEAQMPSDVHYNAEQTVQKSEGMLRLTELGETVTKTYLLEKSGPVYLGAEYGKAAVFRRRDPAHNIRAEIFTYEGVLYVRGAGGGNGMLRRGKKRAPWDRAVSSCAQTM